MLLYSARCVIQTMQHVDVDLVSMPLLCATASTGLLVLYLVTDHRLHRISLGVEFFGFLGWGDLLSKTIP